jgi:hypothetical protein
MDGAPVAGDADVVGEAAGKHMVSTGASGSTAREARATADRVRSLSAELRRVARRHSGFAVAATSEPRTAAAFEPLESCGWRVLHDRRWPGSTRANVDHVAVGPGGVAVIDSKHWSGTISVIAGRLSLPLRHAG